MRYAICAAMIAAAMLGGAEVGCAADKQDDAKQPAKPAPAAKPEAKAKPADAKPQAGSKPAPTNKPTQTNKPTETSKPGAAKPATAAKPVSFKADVAPILVQHCLACHGPSDPKGEYQLQTFERLTKAGASGLDPVVAGKPDEAELLRLLMSDDKEERMPKDGDPLKKEQIDVIRRWIAEGAKFDAPNKAAELVSLVPRKAHPNPPETYRTAMPVTALAFAPSGEELAVGGYHEILIWSTQEPKLLRRIKDVEQRVFGLAYSADGKQLAVAGGTPGVSGEAALYDPASGKLIRRLGTMSDVALGLAYSPDGKQLAVCAADRSIRVYDPASGKETLLIEDHADWVMCIAWSADGKRLVSGSRDKTAKVFDAATGDSQTTYPGHGETVLGVAFAPDGKTVYSSGADKKIHLWNPEDAKQTATIVGFAGEVYRVQIVDGELFSCSADKTAKRHQLSDRKATGDYKGHADYVFSLAVHPGSKRLATGGFDGEVKLWNLDDAKEVASFRAAPGLTVASAEKK